MNTDESRGREEELFGEALALPAAERAGFLARACPDDPELRRAVGELLRASDSAGGFMAVPAAPEGFDALLAAAVPEDKPGDRIGRYKLLQKIGEGGCGIVYMAGQEEPIRRRVALKVIKLGMDTREVIARFESERQALALMDHPAIAKVFDAGATATGRPYFVMELVRGVKITDYCDRHNLATSDRLQLFARVCHAIHHAHQKGIIHRDLKPSNILVTLQDGAPTPKIIDFGIAKATQGRLTDKTLFTAFEQFIGTPAYMSPEQAEMSSEEVDPRCDIYSLGVLLYELLTGRTPLDTPELLRIGFDAMRRHIREVEPPTPSNRLRTLESEMLTTTAHLRGTEPARLIHLVHGDLDWIVLKALEKNRARRYGSAEAFADDLRRHLEHRPVAARRPSLVYRVSKFLRRNRPNLISAGAALLVVLAAGLWVFQSMRPAGPIAPTSADRPQSGTSEKSGKVGLLGEAEALVFVGNEAFSTRSLRAGFARSDDFRNAAHPEAPLSMFLESTRELLVRGYRSQGFPDVTATARIDPRLQRVKLTISEGPRFLAGDIRVSGTNRLRADEVIAALATAEATTIEPLAQTVLGLFVGKHPAPVDPGRDASAEAPALFAGFSESVIALWKPDTPVAFDETMVRPFEDRVRRLCAIRGLLQAGVKAEIVRVPGSNHAALEIRVDEGPEAIVGEITVQGNARSPADAIVACTGLKPGERFDALAFGQAHVALWSSARFYWFEVVVRARGTGGIFDLTISVEESEAMPPLSEPLPRHMEALARCANWLTTEGNRREIDIAVTWPHRPAMQIAVTPIQATAVYVEDPAKKQLMALLVREDNVRLFGSSGATSSGFELIRAIGRPNCFVHATTNSSRVDRERRCNLTFGVGFSGDPMPAPVILAPLIACQYLAPKVTPRFADGEVELTGALGGTAYRLRLREETGELLECEATPMLVADQSGSASTEPRISLRFEAGDFARVAARIDREWQALPFDPARRWSVADVLVDSDLGLQLTDTPAARADLLTTAALLRMGERVLAMPELRTRLDNIRRPDETPFDIPVTTAGNPTTVSEVATLIAKMAHEAGGMLGPPRSWPARLACELGYLASGHAEYTAATLDQLARDPDMGPIGSLLTARLLRLCDMPQAWRFARRACERGSLDEFRADWEMLFEGDTPVARWTRQLLPAIAALTDAELDAVVTRLSPDVGKVLRATIGQLRAGKSEGVAATLRPLLQAWWEQEMRPHLPVRVAAFLHTGDPIDPTTVAVTANGAPLSRSLLALARRHSEMLPPLPPSTGAPLALAPGQTQPDVVLENLITFTLVQQDAAARGEDLPAAVDRIVAEQVRERHGGERADYREALARGGLSERDHFDLLLLGLARDAADRVAAATAAATSHEPAPPGLNQWSQGEALQAYLDQLRATAFVCLYPAPAE